jgi:anti-sigma B factor antagonist
MEINLKKYSSIYILDIKGEIDLYNYGNLKEVINKMKEKGIQNYILNFEEVNYIDSSGIGTILSIYTAMTDEKKNFWIANLHGSVKRVIELTKLDKFLPIATSIEEAIKKIKKNTGAENE